MSDSLVKRAGFVWQFPAAIDRVVDGDTVICHVVIMPGEERHGVNVRVDGINAIELSQKFGTEAKDAVASLAPFGTQVTLVITRREKYGRLLARIVLPDGSDLGMMLLTMKASDGVTPLAVPYNP